MVSIQSYENSPKPESFDVSRISAVLEHLPNILLKPLFFGIVFAAAVFGVVSLQVYHYFVHFDSDPFLGKCLVGFMWLISATHLSTSFYIAYYLLVLAWNRPIVLLAPSLFQVIQHQLLLMIFMLNYVHILYALLAWKLKCHAQGIVTYIILVVTLVGQGIGIYATVRLYEIDPNEGLQHAMQFSSVFGRSVLYPSFSSAMIIDSTLSLFLCFVLYRSQDEFSVSRTPFSLLAKYFVTSGLLVSTLEIVIFVTSIALPDNLVFFTLEMLLPSFHAFCYLSLLNARKSFRHGMNCTTAPGVPIAIHVSSFTMVHSGQRPPWSV